VLQERVHDNLAVATGWMLLAAMVSMSCLALPFVARHSFTTFYRTHILLALAVFVFALFHGFGSAVWHGYAPMSVPGALFWFLDLVVRIVFMNCVIPPFFSSSPFTTCLFDSVQSESTAYGLAIKDGFVYVLGCC
jgi:hypothetical protein